MFQTQDQDLQNVGEGGKLELKETIRNFSDLLKKIDNKLYIIYFNKKIRSPRVTVSKRKSL